MENREEIEAEIVNFYEKLYTCTQWSRPLLDGLVFNQISSSKAEMLESDFSEEEIKAAEFGEG